MCCAFETEICDFIHLSLFYIYLQSVSCYCWLFGLLVSRPSPPYLQQQLAAVAAHAAAAQAQQQAHQVQQQQQQQVQQQPVLTQRPNALSPLTASQLVLSRNSAQSTVSFAVVRHKSRRQMRRKYREGGIVFFFFCLGGSKVA